MRKIQVITIILILAMQLAMAHVTLATHSVTIAWVKTQKDDPSYPLMPGAPNEYFWNGITPKWINFTVTNSGPDAIKEIKLVFEKYPDGSPMFNFSQTSQSKPGWYATPDEFGVNKRPTVLYFRTDSEYIQAGETVTFSLLMTGGPEECRHNIDVWTVDAGSGAAPSTNFYELWMLIDQHDPSVTIIQPHDGDVIKDDPVTVEALAIDLEGPHSSWTKNATLRVHYEVEPGKFHPPDITYVMKYDPHPSYNYTYTLTDGNGLVDEAYHTITVTVYDYAENGPVTSSLTFFWFKSATRINAYTTDPCFLQNQPVGHQGGNATVVIQTGFRPFDNLTVTLGPVVVGHGQANKWGGFQYDFVIPNLPRNFNPLNPSQTLPYELVVNDDPLTIETPFTIIPWMQNAQPAIVHVDEPLTVTGTGFAPLVSVNVIYRDISRNRVFYDSASEWSDNATLFTWSPHLDNVIVTTVITDASGDFTVTFPIPESYGGTHPVFGKEVLTGVRSGWMPGTTPAPRPNEDGYPESAIPHVMTKVWTDPTIGLSGQFIRIYASGLPLPEYSSSTYYCKAGQTTVDLHNKTLALDFGPNTYWVFEKGFILNNEFDLAWSMQLYLPFAYWYNHQDPTSPTWNGTLYWKDFNGNFHTGSQFLKVPALIPGNYTIALYEFDRQTDTDEKDYMATTDFTVLKDPLYVRASSGTLYFKGEKVTAYAEVDLDGVATNPTAISFRLYYEDSFFMTLTAEPISGAQGLYVASFTCPPQEGNYFVQVNASMALGGATLSGFGVTSFVVSPTLDGLNATLTAIHNGLATINTSMGTITLDLGQLEGNVTAINGKVATISTSVGSISTDVSTINGKITSMDGNLATVSTNLGTLKTDIATINGKLVSLNDSMATVQTDVGTLKTTLDSIGATITATGADTVTIKTAVGDIQGKITSIEGKTADIQTNLGLISTSTDSIKTQTGLQPTGIALSLIAALAAIIAAVLIFRKLYK